MLHSLFVAETVTSCRYIDGGVSSLREIDYDTDNSIESHEPPTNTPKSRFSKMTAGLCEVLEDIGLISFLPLNIEDKDVRIFRLLDAYVCYKILRLFFE